MSVQPVPEGFRVFRQELSPIHLLGLRARTGRIN